MFRQMRRKERQLEEVEAKELLKEGQYGVLSMVGSNGYGYGVPISYVYLDNAIYIHSAQAGFKIDSIKENNKVSFCVVGKTNVLPQKFSTEYESVIVFGEADEVEGDEKINALTEFIKKYSPEFIELGKQYISKACKATKVTKVQVEHITGKARK